MVNKQIFRAYDIRGVYPDALSEEALVLIGKALGSLLQEKGEKKVLLARDGRLSGPVLFDALIDGLTQTGTDVVSIGVVPTPLLYFATKEVGITSGLMLTGSHNPSQYNGVKSVIAGQSLFGDDVAALFDRIQAGHFVEGKGSVSELTDIIEKYIARVASDVKLARPLKVAIDCGNGVAGNVAPALFEALGCDVIPLYCDVDGAFPNHHPDPSKAENLKDLVDAVLKNKADIGLAFDGDGDRLGVITSRGDAVWPDRQLILLGQDVLTREPGAKVIYDVKCTKHLKTSIEAAGGEALMSRTGHSYVKAMLNETGAALAGEMSGHIFFKERWYGFDDGLYTGARMLEVISKDERDSATIFDGVPDSMNTPELQLHIDEDKKFSFMNVLLETASFDSGDVCTIDGLRVDFDDGWGLVRASNTTPCIVMRFEADDENSLARIQAAFRTQLLAIDKGLELPF